MLVCPHHKEYEVTLIQTIAFKGTQAWCPFCGHKTKLPDGDFEGRPDTPALKEMEMKYRIYTKDFLEAHGCLGGRKTRWKGEMVLWKALPDKERDRRKDIMKGWKYEIKVESIRPNEVFGTPYVEPPKPVCARCNKPMYDKNGASYIGICFSVFTQDENTEDPDIIEHIKKQWGKYYPAASSPGGMSFCFECYVGAFMRMLHCPKCGKEYGSGDLDGYQGGEVLCPECQANFL